MIQIFRLVIFLQLLTLPAFLYAAIPPTYQAQYELNKYGMTLAQSDVSFQKQSAGNWVYHSETKLRGLASMFRKDHITEHSELIENNGDLRTSRYAYTRKGKKKNRQLNLVFDWNKKIASNTISDDQWSLPLQNDTGDTFSLQLRIMADLAEGKRDLAYNIIDKGKLKTYQFEILGEETIEVPAGSFKTLKIKRTRKNSSRTTLMWCSPELNYLPVKIMHIESDGSKFSLQLTGLKGNITRNKTISASSSDDD